MYGPTLYPGFTKDNRQIILAAPNLSSIDTIVSWLNDEAVMRHLNPEWLPTTPDAERANLESFATDATSINWSIFLADRLVGAAWINEIDRESKTGSLGILLGEKDTWGQGIGTTVGNALCAHMFTMENLDEIHIAFTKENTGSHQIAKKLHFTITEGVAHFTEDKTYPGYDGVLTKEQWSNLNQA